MDGQETDPPKLRVEESPRHLTPWSVYAMRKDTWFSKLTRLLTILDINITKKINLGGSALSNSTFLDTLVILDTATEALEIVRLAADLASVAQNRRDTGFLK